MAIKMFKSILTENLSVQLQVIKDLDLLYFNKEIFTEGVVLLGSKS